MILPDLWVDILTHIVWRGTGVQKYPTHPGFTHATDAAGTVMLQLSRACAWGVRAGKEQISKNK